MKKLLSLSLCVILLLNLLVVGVIPTYAETPVNLDDHLVVHYDFKGATVAEALTDKAPTRDGSVADNLVAKTTYNTETEASEKAVGSDAFNAAFSVDPVSGTVTNLTQKASLQAATSTDVQKIYNKDGLTDGSTLFFRFKVKDLTATGSNTYLLNMFANGSGGRMIALCADTTGNIYACTGANSAKGSTVYKMLTNDGTKLVMNDTYINFAITIKQQDATNNLVGYTSFFSVGVPTKVEDWCTFATYDNVKFRTDVYESVPFSMFDVPYCSTSANTGLTLDDVRLYDTVLTKDQLSTMFVDSLKKDSFDIGFSMLEGARIRLNEVTGIRFESTVDVATYNALVATYGAENVKFGTLIAPESYYIEAGAMTFEALEKLDKTVKYLKVEAGAFYKTGNTVNTIAGSIAKIAEKNYKANYTAVGYIEITVGEDIFYLYADAPQTRSIAQVAEAAVNDRSTEKGGEYQYEIADDNAKGAYSPYDKDQIDLLKTFY